MNNPMRKIQQEGVNANKEAKKANREAKYTFCAGQVFGALLVIGSVIDTIPNLANETFTLVNNAPDIIGIVGGAILFIASTTGVTQVKSFEEERKKSALNMALSNRTGDEGYPLESTDINDSHFNPN